MTILNETQWQALEAAEAPLYENNWGANAYTDVFPREDSQLAAAMWEQAQLGVEGMLDTVDPDFQYGTEAAQAAEEKEIAKRVAVSIAVLAFGTDFVPSEVLA